MSKPSVMTDKLMASFNEEKKAMAGMSQTYRANVSHKARENLKSIRALTLDKIGEDFKKNTERGENYHISDGDIESIDFMDRYSDKDKEKEVKYLMPEDE